ncbi:hypothetical protein IID20_04345 [Patescibacteria group bacterium]|nr:hypothetical protein [Patescibacteria group bacterium]
MIKENSNEVLGQNIIATLGLEKLPDQEKAILIDQMAKLVEKRVVLGLLERLSAGDNEKFEKISENDTQVKIEFLQQRFPDLTNIIEEAVVKLKKEMKADADQAEKELEE